MMADASENPNERIADLIESLLLSIRETTGCHAEITIWPEGVPLHAMTPKTAATVWGVKVIAPRIVVERLVHYQNDFG